MVDEEQLPVSNFGSEIMNISENSTRSRSVLGSSPILWNKERSNVVVDCKFILKVAL